MPFPPPLCINCYRSEEDKIRDDADEEHDEIREERENDRRTLEDPNLTSTERSRLEAQIEEGYMFAEREP